MKKELIKALIQRLMANTVGLHEANGHSGTVNLCGDTNCKDACDLIERAQNEGK